MSQLIVHPHYWTAYVLLQRILFEPGSDADWAASTFYIGSLRLSITEAEKSMLDSMIVTETFRPDGQPS